MGGTPPAGIGMGVPGRRQRSWLTGRGRPGVRTPSVLGRGAVSGIGHKCLCRCEAVPPTRLGPLPPAGHLSLTWLLSCEQGANPVRAAWLAAPASPAPAAVLLPAPARA